VRISEWPTPECQLSAYPRHILTPRCLVGDAHDHFADVGVGRRQPVLSCSCAATAATSSAVSRRASSASNGR
jgi:hypothetical protein